mmetsp:Transcript_20269/g.41229  ORF Transcript_20269/g.41229 Transcript_20269/m.41229 type:complete len:231 (-) Transcript_20269:2291-2983(-)
MRTMDRHVYHGPPRVSSNGGDTVVHVLHIFLNDGCRRYKVPVRDWRRLVVLRVGGRVLRRHLDRRVLLLLPLLLGRLAFLETSTGALELFQRHEVPLDPIPVGVLAYLPHSLRAASEALGVVLLKKKLHQVFRPRVWKLELGVRGHLGVWVFVRQVARREFIQEDADGVPIRRDTVRFSSVFRPPHLRRHVTLRPHSRHTPWLGLRHPRRQPHVDQPYVAEFVNEQILRL